MSNFHPTNQFAARIGRFEYFDGLEKKAKDPLLQKIIQSRISSRLISNFAFTAVQRTYDGVQLVLNSGANNVTLFGARPTQGVFQVKGEDELDVDNYYGAYTHSGGSATNPNQFRVFADGYIDHRTLVLKTDNRSTPAKTADKNKIEIATWGGNFEQVINTPAAGKFYLLGWGVLQTGSWGSLSQLSTAAVGEAGWQLPVPSIKPGISAGYSYGSGDGNATDTRHGTFFQVLTTPRQYARFPFYNMMNNEDAYLTVIAQPLKQLSLSSEVTHAAPGHCHRPLVFRRRRLSANHIRLPGTPQATDIEPWRMSGTSMPITASAPIQRDVLLRARLGQERDRDHLSQGCRRPTALRRNQLPLLKPDHAWRLHSNQSVAARFRSRQSARPLGICPKMASCSPKTNAIALKWSSSPRATPSI